MMPLSTISHPIRANEPALALRAVNATPPRMIKEPPSGRDRLHLRREPSISCTSMILILVCDPCLRSFEAPHPANEKPLYGYASADADHLPTPMSTPTARC